MNKIYIWIDINYNNLEQLINLEILDSSTYFIKIKEHRLNNILEYRKKYNLNYILKYCNFNTIDSIKYYTMKNLINFDINHIYDIIKIYNLFDDEIYELILRLLVSPIIKNEVLKFNLKSSNCVYCLKLLNDFYYIGYSNDIIYRLTTHILSLKKTSKMIKKYYVTKIIDIKNGTLEDENFTTLFYKKKYGYNKVEGGKWCAKNQYLENYCNKKKKNIITINF